MTFQYPQPDRIVWAATNAATKRRLQSFSIRNRIELFGPAANYLFLFHASIVSVSATGSNCLGFAGRRKRL